MPPTPVPATFAIYARFYSAANRRDSAIGQLTAFAFVARPVISPIKARHLTVSKLHVVGANRTFSTPPG